MSERSYVLSTRRKGYIMSQTVGQSTYYDFKELRQMVRKLAEGGKDTPHSPAHVKARLLRYSLRVTNLGASIVAHVELPSGFIAERAMLL